MDIAEHCEEDGWSDPNCRKARLSWPSAVPVISSASAALWAVVALMAAVVIT
jgi:hypothetical protein